MERIHLTHPPLLEISLSVEFQSHPLDADMVRAAVVKAAAEFKTYSPILENNFNIDLTSPSPGIKETKIWRGGNFKRDDHHVLIVRVGGSGGISIAYSMVNTYTEWENFSSSARQVIQKVQQELGVTEVRRIGVRCIDRLAKPYDGCALRDVIKSVPDEITDAGDEDLKEFFYRDTKYYLCYKLYATLIRVSQRRASGPEMSYVIDTDVFDFPKKEIDNEYWDSLLPRMRELKNVLFIGSIGPKSLEACQ